MSRYRTYTPNDEQPLLDGDEQFMGVNMRLEPDKVQPGFLAYGSQNLRFRNGEGQTRLGLSKPAWLNVCNGRLIGRVTQFYGAGSFLDPNSFEWTMLAADGNIYRCRPGNTRQSVPMPTGVRILSRCSFVQAFGQLLCFRGRYLAPLILDNVDDGFIDLVQQWNATGTYDAAVTALSTVADEVAYGPFQSTASVNYVDKVATVVTSVAHGYISGADVTVTGATPSGLNGRFNIAVIDETTFTYTFAGDGSSGAATGTIKVSNMSLYWQALGTRRTNSGITWATNVATVTTSASHGFTTGQYVTIAGADTLYNGTYLITVTGATTFTYALGGSPTTPASAPGTSTTSLVLAGQSPDTNPEAWKQIFNVLPNADDAVYTNNQLFVPTSYAPGSAGYNSTEVTYKKKDYILLTDYLDPIHFDIANGVVFANQGDDDEIQCLVVYNMTTVLVIKSKSWGILTGIGANPAAEASTLNLNMFGATYGACALRGAVTGGEDVLFPSTKRGICSCYMTQLGQVRGTDTPFSNEMQKVVDRINWNYAAGIRMAWWNDCLYCAVPLDGGLTTPELTFTSGFITDKQRVRHKAQFYTLTPGATYYWRADISKGNAPVLRCGAVTLTASGYFLANNALASVTYVSSPGQIFAQVYGNNTLMVYDYRMGFSGSPLTYDFRGGQWAGVDTGPFGVLEFFKATVNGLQRLFFIGSDGFVSMLEEHPDGDQIYDGGSPMGLSVTPIQTIAVTRGYKTQGKGEQEDPEGERKWGRLNLTVSTWNPSLTMSANTGAAYSTLPLVTDLTFDRVSYYHPWDAAAWITSNENADFQTPGRFDYSVALASGGTVLTGGLSLSTMQEITKRVSLRTLIGRFAQFTIACSQGRMSVKSPRSKAIAGARRNGVLI